VDKSRLGFSILESNNLQIVACCENDGTNSGCLILQHNLILHRLSDLLGPDGSADDKSRYSRLNKGAIIYVNPRRNPTTAPA